MMLSLLHWCALRISDFAMFINSVPLWELGGALECWCDEKGNANHG